MPNMNIGQNGIEITILGNDQVSDDLLRITGNLDKLKKKTTETSKTTEGLGKVTAGMSSQFKGLATTLAGPLIGFTALTGAVTGTVAFLKSSINDWVAYNEEIRKLGVATGSSTEDLSRMVQAADDVGVSMSSMQTAMRLMTQNGMKPTIENMAALSDELLSITDDVARAEAMQKIFGKQWQEVAGFVLMGGNAIRESTAAQSAGLVVTEESAAAAREYSIALDGLGDSMTIAKNTIAQALIPGLTDTANAFNELVTAASDADRQMKISSFGFKEWIQYLQGADVDKLYASMMKAKAATEALDKAVANGIITEARSIDIQRRAADGLGDLTDIAREYGVIVKEVDAATGAATTTFSGLDIQFMQLQQHAESSGEQLGKSFKSATREIKTTAQAAGELSEKLRNVPMGIGDQIAADIKAMDFRAAGAGFVEDLRIGIMAASEGGWIDETAVDKALGVLSIAFEDIKVRAGEISRMEAWQNVKQNLQDWGMEAGEAKKIWDELAKYDGRQLDMTALVRLIGIVTGMGGGGGGGQGSGIGGFGRPGQGPPKPIANANGADYIVPPGYPNDTFPVGNAQSGERVIIIPREEQRSGRGVGTTYNLTIYSNAQTESMARDFNMMRAWARA